MDAAWAQCFLVQSPLKNCCGYVRRKSVPITKYFLIDSPGYDVGDVMESPPGGFDGLLPRGVGAHWVEAGREGWREEWNPHVRLKTA